MISSVDSSTRPGCSGNPSIRSPSIWAAARPISASGCRTVVGGGGTQREIGRSSKPTTETSCGTRRPRCRAVSYRPNAYWSLRQRSLSGARGGRAARRRTRSRARAGSHHCGQALLTVRPWPGPQIRTVTQKHRTSNTRTSNTRKAFDHRIAIRAAADGDGDASDPSGPGMAVPGAGRRGRGPADTRAPCRAAAEHQDEHGEPITRTCGARRLPGEQRR